MPTNSSLIVITLSCLLAGCASGPAGEDGIPAPERGPRPVSMLFTGTVDQVSQAITKAFTNGAYHGKGFFSRPYDFVVSGPVRSAVPLTNAWDLAVPWREGGLPLTLV